MARGASRGANFDDSGSILGGFSKVFASTRARHAREAAVPCEKPFQSTRAKVFGKPQRRAKERDLAKLAVSLRKTMIFHVRGFRDATRKHAESPRATPRRHDTKRRKLARKSAIFDRKTAKFDETAATSMTKRDFRRNL
jgi:hypothetical protein